MCGDGQTRIFRTPMPKMINDQFWFGCPNIDVARKCIAKISKSFQFVLIGENFLQFWFSVYFGGCSKIWSAEPSKSGTVFLYFYFSSFTIICACVSVFVCGLVLCCFQTCLYPCAGGWLKMITFCYTNFSQTEDCY